MFLNIKKEELIISANISKLKRQTIYVEFKYKLFHSYNGERKTENTKFYFFG